MVHLNWRQQSDQLNRKMFTAWKEAIWPVASVMTPCKSGPASPTLSHTAHVFGPPSQQQLSTTLLYQIPCYPLYIPDPTTPVCNIKIVPYDYFICQLE